MHDNEDVEEMQNADDERNDAPDNESPDASEADSTAAIVSSHAEQFEEEMREYMRKIDARLSQLADAQAAVVSASRIDDTGAETDTSDDDVDDGVLDLIIND